MQEYEKGERQMAIRKENKSIRITLSPITQSVLNEIQEMTGDSKSVIIKEALNYYLTLLSNIKGFIQ